MPREIYDLIGVGIGPFNLSLAALSEGIINAKFFEQKSSFSWHEGLLIEGTTLQVPFLADLVTMVDPTSKYSFLNYLKAHKRLYNFYFFENFHIPRKEYNHYCKWASEQLVSCEFSSHVKNVEWLSSYNYFKVEILNDRNEIDVHFSKDIVLGVGSVPHIPSFSYQGDRVFHSANFLKNIELCEKSKSITVVGSGQSAAEVFYKLLQDQLHFKYELTWCTRSSGFFPMEYSKLGLEHFSPDYTDYFYSLDNNKKKERIMKSDLLYKGISFSTIADIYNLLYERTIGEKHIGVNLISNTSVEDIAHREDNLLVECMQVEEEIRFTKETDMVVLATGYSHQPPKCISGLKDLISLDEDSKLRVTKDYRLELENSIAGNVYVQNAEIHTHGVGAPDLGLGAYRSATIINSIKGKEVYPIQASKNVFQSFSANKLIRSFKEPVHK